MLIFIINSVLITILKLLSVLCDNLSVYYFRSSFFEPIRLKSSTNLFCNDFCILTFNTRININDNKKKKKLNFKIFPKINKNDLLQIADWLSVITATRNI